MEIINYSDKSFAVIGNTYEHKERLKELGGKYNKFLSCGPGWIFPLRYKSTVESFLAGLSAKVEAPFYEKKGINWLSCPDPLGIRNSFEFIILEWGSPISIQSVMDFTGYKQKDFNISHRKMINSSGQHVTDVAFSLIENGTLPPMDEHEACELIINTYMNYPTLASLFKAKYRNYDEKLNEYVNNLPDECPF